MDVWRDSCDGRDTVGGHHVPFALEGPLWGAPRCRASSIHTERPYDLSLCLVDHKAVPLESVKIRGFQLDIVAKSDWLDKLIAPLVQIRPG